MQTRPVSPSAKNHLAHTARGRVEDRLHQEARAEHEALQPLAIGRHVGDRPGRDPGIHRRLRDQRRHPVISRGIERLGK